MTEINVVLPGNPMMPALNGVDQILSGIADIAPVPYAETQQMLAYK